jgi:hypothetical protein
MERIKEVYSSFPKGIPSDENMTFARTNDMNVGGIRDYILKGMGSIINEDVPGYHKEDLIKVDFFYHAWLFILFI